MDTMVAGRRPGLANQLRTRFRAFRAFRVFNGFGVLGLLGFF